VTPRPAHNPARFINRELSWLAFNERVLEEATDPTTPLLERVKFAAITASNLDEFFMVRVAALKRAVEEDEHAPDLSGLKPTEQLAAIGSRAQAMVATLCRLTTQELLPALAGHGVRLLGWDEVDTAHRASLLLLSRKRDTSAVHLQWARNAIDYVVFSECARSNATSYRLVILHQRNLQPVNIP